MNDSKPKKRSLIMAGGGVKVAFQAGVLQVWLDEAGLSFDHADGASGGVFNLAMYCQGMNGTQMADNWRNFDPNLGIEFNWQQYANLFFAESMFKLDRFRESVFPGWGLDWKLIRETQREATFNVYNFSKHELEVITPDRMTEDFLVACVSLPMWFPPVIINGETYIDSVYISDANIQEAIRRGADELWIVWTVSERSEWHAGFLAQYFQIIETAANGHFRRIIRRIEKNNAAIAEGQSGEFGRHIELKILKSEVPLHYLLNLSADRVVEAVNLGVLRGREWCKQQGIALTDSQPDYSTDIHTTPTKLSFSEEMKGYLGFGETDYQRGHDTGKRKKSYVSFNLTIRVDGVNRFITRPLHEAAAEGYITCESLGGQLAVEQGIFNLFVDEADPDEKKMLYRLHFRNAEGEPLTLTGFKEIKDDPGLDLWSDTTTLYTRILKGHLAPDQDADAEVLASGILRIHLLDFLKQLSTFRVEAPSLADKTSALGRFGRLFLGKLWDVYAKEVLSVSPF